MQFSPEFIEELKYRNDMEEVVSSYVTLKRAGSNKIGVCPFHSEKTPSFTVFPAGKNFYCFGCGAGGDVITFIMKIENLDYPAALAFLAKRAGIPLPQEIGQENTSARKKRILEMNRDAARFFHQQLMEEANGKPALSYLTKRALSFSVMKHYGIGFAPNDFQLLRRHLQGKGYTEEELLDGCLCKRSQKNDRLYDYFRNRIMFPIIDVSGNVIAFGGRVLDDSLPKYLNSSDTVVFKKSRNLFSLNFAKSTCSQLLLLCEGYMDVIALNAAGFSNAVATLGTAITPEQARIMQKYTKNVVIAYDSDNAGQAAAQKAVRLLTEVGVGVKVLRMDGAKDPDEYIKKQGINGAARFKQLIEGSRTPFEYRFENIQKKYSMENTNGKIQALQEITALLAEIPSQVERDVYVGKVAEKMEISAESLRNDVAYRSRKEQRQQKKVDTQQIIRKNAGFGDHVNPDYMKNGRAAAAEEGILGILLLYPELVLKIQKGEIPLHADDFFTHFGGRVIEAIFEHTQNGTLDIGILGSVFQPDEMGRITQIMLARRDLTKNDEEVLRELVEVLHHEKAKVDLEKSIAAGELDKLAELINTKKNNRRNSHEQ